MIGLLDYDYEVSKKASIIIPNIEIMKLATYYKTEENRFCRLLSLDEEDLSNYEKIYFFSESHYPPRIPEIYLRSPQVIYGGTAFTKGKYLPFQNEIIDFTIPKTFIYKESLKQKYDDGVKAKVISQVLDSSYYRYFAREQLPIPPVMTNKRVYLYDRDFFYSNWRETLDKIISKKPSSIIRIHPIICHKLSEFFEVRNYPKLKRGNDFILDLNIPLDEVYYMINKYKNYLLADIGKSSNVFLMLGGSYPTSFQYFKDLIYKLNLLYCFWSCGIFIKIKYEPPFIGYKNPIANLSFKIEKWSELIKTKKYDISINDRISQKNKNATWIQERDLLLKFYPSAKDLFNQTINSVMNGGRWRI